MGSVPPPPSHNKMSDLSSGVASKLNQAHGATLKARNHHGYEVYKEFSEFSVKQMREIERVFNKFCHTTTNKIGLSELKVMMEKLGCAQTHLGLKNIMKELDENNGGVIDFREFLLLFRRLKSGELDGLKNQADLDGNEFMQLVDGLMLNEMASVDVTDIGVGRAKLFFEAKINKMKGENKVEEEIKKEQEEKKMEREEKKRRQEEFKKKQDLFKTS